MGVGFHVFFLENEERFEYTRICPCRLSIFFDFAKLKFYHHLQVQGFSLDRYAELCGCLLPFFFAYGFSLDPNHDFPFRSSAITDHLI